MNYIIFVIVALVSFWLGRETGKKENTGFTAVPKEELKALQRDAHEALEERTEKRKAKILEFMKKETVHKEELKLCGIDASKKEFTRPDVENLLEVSAVTARKYLNELEAEGKIVQVGTSGKDVYYMLKTP